MKRFESELPEGYREAYRIDAKNKKTGVLLNVIALVLTVGTILTLWPLLNMPDGEEALILSPLRFLLFAAALLGTLVLHELTHGAAYKLLTRQKLSFGITPLCAYCGLPDLYVTRRTALIAVLAPFVLFSLLLGALTAFLPLWVDRFFAALLFAIHFGGCAGDLLVAALLLFRFRSPATLLRDTGPAQIFYVR